MKNSEHLPMYGAGPHYVALIIELTIMGVLFSKTNLLKACVINELKIPFIILGVLLISAGATIWSLAVFRDKIDDGIENNKLITTGVYSVVRNPIYSAFMMICTSVCLFTNNLYLLPLPFIYWLILTLMMKSTEEKWLKELYGQEYVDYCKKVNRCIPCKR